MVLETRVTEAPGGAGGRARGGRDGARSGRRPAGSGRQLDGAAGEERPGRLVGLAGRQGHLDPGLQLGDPGGDLDQREPDRVELGIAPERKDAD